MKSSVETLEDHRVKLTIEVEETEIETEVDKAFKQIAREVRLPGFRPGKAPRKVLEARLGKGYARSQALEAALPDYYRKAAIEHDVDVIAAPDLDITSGQENGPVVFAAVVLTRPTITIAGHANLVVEVDSPLVTDEEVQAQLDQLRERFAERETVAREVTDGDFAVITITTTYEGEEVAGLTATDYTYEVGSGGVVPDLDENLRGASAGDIIAFEAEHPDPEEDGELEFEILVKEVQAKKLPELSDEFAQEASEFDTAAELRQDVVDRLTASKRARIRNEVVDKTGTALAQLVDLELPEELVQSEVQNRLQDMAMRLSSQGIQLEQFLEMTGQSPQDFLAQLEEPAAEAARIDLALRAVADVEDLDLEDDELDREIAATAEQVEQDPDTIRARFVENGQLSSVIWEMRKQKAMTWLLERVTISDDTGAVHTWESLQESGDDDEDDTTDETLNDESAEAEPAGEEE